MLFRALSAAKQLWQDGESSADRIRQQMTALIRGERLAQIDYVSVADLETLAELTVVDRPAVASLAVRIGKTRLIDNMLLQ